MKNAAILASLLLTGSIAMACPNLSGTYTCPANTQTNEPEQVVTFSQSEANGVTTYTVTTQGENEASTVLADGQARESRYTDKDQNGTETTTIVNETWTCVGQDLIGAAQIDLDPNPYSLSAQVDIKINLTAEGDLKTESKQITYQDGSEVNTENGTELCKRNK